MSNQVTFEKNLEVFKEELRGNLKLLKEGKPIDITVALNTKAYAKALGVKLEEEGK